MRYFEDMQLRRLCKKFELDPMEIDSSISYIENKDHLLSLVPRLLRDQGFQGEYERYQAMLEARAHQGPYHKGAICPNCGEGGSGLHMKWVLNERKKRYEPYFSFAHSIKIEDRYRVKWHYVRKARALEILQNTWVGEQFNLRSAESVR